jgi:hypothetical protein
VCSQTSAVQFDNQIRTISKIKLKYLVKGFYFTLSKLQTDEHIDGVRSSCNASGAVQQLRGCALLWMGVCGE